MEKFFIKVVIAIYYKRWRIVKEERVGSEATAVCKSKRTDEVAVHRGHKSGEAKP